MKLLEEFNEEDLAKKLDSSSELLLLRIIPLALAGGVMMFGIVVTTLFFLSEGGVATGTSPSSIVGILSMAHGLLFVATLAAGMILFKIMLSPARIEAALGRTMGVQHGEDTDDPSAKFLMLYRQALLIRLLLFETGALFGLVVCLLAVLGDEIRQQPAYCLNAGSALFMIGYVILTLPNKSRLMEFMAQKKAMARLGPV